MKWTKTYEKLPTNGRYYVKMLMNDFTITKGCETIEDGEWKLGSGHFIVREVIEWLDEEESTEQ